jgi:hypothetical protein
MKEVKYAIDLTEKDYDIIKSINPKICEQIRRRKNDITFEEMIVFIDDEKKLVFFDYME